MRTTWRVTKVTETEGSRVAELARVEWFKRNPVHEAAMDRWNGINNDEGEQAADADWAENYGDEWIDEFLEAQPGEDGAEFIDSPSQDRLTIDISDGLDLHAGDDVFLTLDAVERVPA